MAKKKKSGSDNVVAQARGKSAPSSKGPLGKRVWENVKSIAGAILIYLVIKTLLIEAFRIPSGSMIPTLMVGDWLFVNKLAYGPHITLTKIKLPGYRTPQHGDVVVFDESFAFPDNRERWLYTAVTRAVERVTVVV